MECFDRLAAATMTAVSTSSHPVIPCTGLEAVLYSKFRMAGPCQAHLWAGAKGKSSRPLSDSSVGYEISGQANDLSLFSRSMDAGCAQGRPDAA